MNFDHFSIVLLVLRQDAPELDDAEAATLQDAHLDHLARLHEAGSLLAAGPLAGGGDNPFRGLTILKAGVEEATALAEADPAVVAGRFSVTVMPWMVPAGAMAFQPAAFRIPPPRYAADAAAGTRRSRTRSAPARLAAAAARPAAPRPGFGARQVSSGASGRGGHCRRPGGQPLPYLAHPVRRVMRHLPAGLQPPRAPRLGPGRDPGCCGCGIVCRGLAL